MSLQGTHERGVAVVAIDDPKFGADRERAVRIVISSAQAAELVRRLQAVLDEIVV
jgi:alpha-beta hydrolase superfamily lysophospholipase